VPAVGKRRPPQTGRAPSRLSGSGTGTSGAILRNFNRAAERGRAATTDRRRLERVYSSPYRSGEAGLVLHNYRVCLVRQAWYLIARPEGSAHSATYRVPRFRSLKALDAAAEVPDDFVLRAYFGDAWAVYRGPTSYGVELRFEP
jgi:hypothetical protein